MREPKPWKVIESEVLLDKYPWLRVVRERVELPNGVIINDYLLAAWREYAMVVAIDDDHNVLLVRQYKHGQDERSPSSQPGTSMRPRSPYRLPNANCSRRPALLPHHGRRSARSARALTEAKRQRISSSREVSRTSAIRNWMRPKIS